MQIEVKVEMVPLNKLVHPAYNPRFMPSQQMRELKEEIKEFGMVENIVVNKRNMHIVGGNQRAYVLEQAGAENAPVHFVDLDEKAEKRLNLALNKISGDWDEVKLKEVLLSLEGEIDNTGFSEEEVDDLVGEEEVEDLTAPDAAEELSKFVTLSFGEIEEDVPKEVYLQFVEEINRLKGILRGEEDPDEVPIVTPLECMIQLSAQTPPESLK